MNAKKYGLPLLMGTALLIVDAGAASAASSKDDEVSFGNRGLRYRSADRNVDIRLGGRFHLDGGIYSSGGLTQFNDDVDIRRARITLTARLFKDITFKVDHDVAGTSTGWKNLWVNYSGIEGFDLRVGNVIAPFGMEDNMGSNNIALMERSLVNVLSPGFYQGVMVRVHDTNWGVAAGYFGNPMDQGADKKSADGQGFVARVAVAPMVDRKSVVHFAASVETRSLDQNGLLGPQFRVAPKPESGITGTRLIDTGTIIDADKYTNLGFEAAAMAGPFMVQGEYYSLKLDRTVGPSVTFSGYYAQASVVVTGEARRYSKSNHSFGGIRPKSLMALELAARYSSIDLTDQDIFGGEETNYTLGANFYFGRNVRLMADYTHAKAKPNSNGLNESLDIVLGRFQVNF